MYLKQKKQNRKKNQKINQKKTSYKKIKDDYKKFIKYIENESEGIKYDLFKDYFDLVAPTVLAKKLYETKDKKENDKLVELINVRWSGFKRCN